MIRLLVFFVPFIFFTLELSWRNGLVIGTLAVTAEFCYVWRRHQMATAIFKSKRAARSTARALCWLEQGDYYAFHDCLLAGDDTADHILIGPTGIWLINSETFRKQPILWPDDNRREADPHPPLSPITTVRRYAQTMAEFVRDALHKDIATHAMLAVRGSPWSRFRAEEVGGVPVVHSRFVAWWVLRHGEPIYSEEEVEQIAVTVAGRLSLRRQSRDDELPWVTRALRIHRPDIRLRRPPWETSRRPALRGARRKGRS